MDRFDVMDNFVEEEEGEGAKGEGEERQFARFVSFDGGLGAEAKEYRPISGHRLFPHFFLPRHLLDDRSFTDGYDRKV